MVVMPLQKLDWIKNFAPLYLRVLKSKNLQNGDERVFPIANYQSETPRWSFACVATNIIRIGAVGGFASEPAFGLVRWELWQILTFWFFWVKPKERRKREAKTSLKAAINLIESKTIWKKTRMKIRNSNIFNT